MKKETLCLTESTRIIKNSSISVGAMAQMNFSRQFLFEVPLAQAEKSKLISGAIHQQWFT